MDEGIKYCLIWCLLIILTLMELATLRLNLPVTTIALSIIGLASIKALLIALYYQHLIKESESVGWFYLASIFFILVLVVTWITGV
jgi:caa(3)-type oxidase subunit IV